jgi:hypothetical protein
MQHLTEWALSRLSLHLHPNWLIENTDDDRYAGQRVHSLRLRKGRLSERLQQTVPVRGGLH